MNVFSLYQRNLMRRSIKFKRWKNLSRELYLNRSYHTGALSSLLKPHHLEIVAAQRKMLKGLYQSLDSMEIEQDRLDFVLDTLTQVDEVFMIVVVGEFNAGKSTFINSLLGDRYLKDGVLPTTDKINILRYSSLGEGPGVGDSKRSRGAARTSGVLLEEIEETSLPVSWLRHVALVDTPGTNALVERHEHLTQRIIPRADLVLFVTSAERPLTESEAAFLSKIRTWGKKVVVVINKIDILQSEEKQQITDFVSQNVAKIIGGVKAVPVFAVSSKNALSSKLVVHGEDPALGPGARLWTESQLGVLETYLQSMLGTDELVAGKLENVLGVADRVISTSLSELETSARDLEADSKVLELIDETLELFVKDLNRDNAQCNDSISEIFHELQTRCDSFLEDSLSVFKFDIIFDRLKFQTLFENEVVIDVTSPVEALLGETSALVVLRGRTQAKAVLEYIGPRSRSRRLAKGMIGSIKDESFDSMRYDLIQRVTAETHKVLDKLDHIEEGERIRAELYTGLIQAIGAFTVSAGSAAALMNNDHMLNPWSVFAVSSVFVFGLVIVPLRRKAIRKEYTRRLDVIRKQLQTSVKRILGNQVQIIRESIINSVSPYSRYISLEKQRVHTRTEELYALREEVVDIRKKVKLLRIS